MHRYVSDDEDSARWSALALRDTDIVVSSRSKHGTTWVQAILLMLVHGTPDLPASLPTLSPWVDHLVEPIDDVVRRLEAQDHRRVLKTHTPLDGIPRAPGVRYVVVARHPLDAAVSLYHQGMNIDRGRLAELTGNPAGPTSRRPDLATWLADWVRAEREPAQSLDSLQGVALHLADAWARRDDGVVLVHYADLLDDLPGQVRALAASVGIDASGPLDDVVAAAGFAAMRDRADDLVPDPVGILRDHAAFFRGGRSGAGEATLPADLLATYHDRVATLFDPQLADWLHR